MASITACAGRSRPTDRNARRFAIERSTMKRILWQRVSHDVCPGAFLVLAGLALRSYPAATEAARALPAPAVDATPGQATSAVAVLAGGCFWGVQGVFQHVKGVTSAVSGYAGGDKKAAQYEIVSSGTTGHAESVQVTYDPRQISYGRLLQIFFSVVHDPTELNRQGPIPGRSIARRSSPQTPSRRTLRRRTSRSSIRPVRSRRPSSQKLNRTARSIRPRAIIRIS